MSALASASTGPTQPAARPGEPGRRGAVRAGLMLATLALVVLPWVAPILMRLGQPAAGGALYTVYGLLCHQLPQRSFFLFGPQASYSLAELEQAGIDVADVAALRAFRGSPAMGYKVAWSDRMVSLYSSLALTALGWWPLRGRVRPLPLAVAAALMLPMVVDGLSHTVSDLAGLGQGFRDHNAWLIALSGGRIGTAFAAGDHLGSFNSLARLLTGGLFGAAAALTMAPRLAAPARAALAGADAGFPP